MAMHAPAGAESGQSALPLLPADAQGVRPLPGTAVAQAIKQIAPGVVQPTE
jgi:hypothetical protein